MNIQPLDCQLCIYGGNHHPIMGWYCETCSEKFSKIANNFHEIVTCKDAYGTPKCKEAARLRDIKHITVYKPLFEEGNTKSVTLDKNSFAYTLQRAACASAVSTIVELLEDIGQWCTEEELNQIRDLIDRFIT